MNNLRRIFGLPMTSNVDTAIHCMRFEINRREPFGLEVHAGTLMFSSCVRTIDSLILVLLLAICVCVLCLCVVFVFVFVFVVCVCVLCLCFVFVFVFVFCVLCLCL